MSQLVDLAADFTDLECKADLDPRKCFKLLDFLHALGITSDNHSTDDRF